MAAIVFLIVGIAMTVAKWAFGLDEISNWNLVPLLLGIALNWHSRRLVRTSKNG